MLIHKSYLNNDFKKAIPIYNFERESWTEWFCFLVPHELCCEWERPRILMPSFLPWFRRGPYDLVKHSCWYVRLGFGWLFCLFWVK